MSAAEAKDLMGRFIDAGVDAGEDICFAEDQLSWTVEKDVHGNPAALVLTLDGDNGTRTERYKLHKVPPGNDAEFFTVEDADGFEDPNGDFAGTESYGEGAWYAHENGLRLVRRADGATEIVEDFT